MLEKEAPEGRTRKERASKLRNAGESQVKDNYIPLKIEDIKQSIEIPVKQIDKQSLETIVKKGTKRASKRKYSRKTEAEKESSLKKTERKSRGTKKEKEFIIPSSSLKKDGYELVITEKPQAAEKIAHALSDSGRINKKTTPNKVAYYEISREGKKIVIGCAVGHLFTLRENKGSQKNGSNIPTFDISWVPNWQLAKRQNDFSKRYYDTLQKLSKEAGSLTVATDYDIEGEVIGLNVVRFLCGQKDASRMKFSTLTNDELNEAYEKKFKTLSWGQAIAGETRHFLDWFYGINLSRALMAAIKTTGTFKIMSIGRVQGPALHLIVEKEKEIQAFKSTPYWQIFITLPIGGPKNSEKSIELKHNRDITNKSDLEKFENLKGQKVSVETKKSEQILPPLPPFNLTTLQTEAYRLYNITPTRTLQIAQSLYLGGLISYPRTSSQKLPDSIAYRKILDKLAEQYLGDEKKHLIKRQRPIEGKKTDPAHPSIYPTGESNVVVSEQEKKIYDLIVKRFLSLFCDDAKIDNKTIRATLEGNEKESLEFTTRGAEIKQKAWLSIYPIKMEEREVPDINGTFVIENSRIEEKETQPPKRYSPASILSQLEKRNLGTKATRASILETLYDRGYIKEQSIQATPLGISLVNTLEKYSPIIIDEKLTRHFEKEMESIETAQKGLLEKEKTTIEEAKKSITEIIIQFKKNEDKIGKDLVNATRELHSQEKAANTLEITCPKCNEGKLAVTYSPKNKKYFIACNAYPKCKNTYSLPPGNIKKLDKNCTECNFPMMMRLMSGKRPWIFCFNPECPSRKNKENREGENKEETNDNQSQDE